MNKQGMAIIFPFYNISSSNFSVILIWRAVSNCGDRFLFLYLYLNFLHAISVLKQSISYTGGSKRCNLCLEEKLCNLKDKDKQNLLNKKSEIVST